MQKIFLMAMLSLTFVSWTGQNEPNNPPQTREDYDNTGRNIRDRNSATTTPMDQSESEADRTITQRIRQSIMAERSLSTDAKNIKIITINGVVTLRGPVANSQEKDIITKKAGDVQGVSRIENQLEIIRK